MCPQKASQRSWLDRGLVGVAGMGMRCEDNKVQGGVPKSAPPTKSLHPHHAHAAVSGPPQRTSQPRKFRVMQINAFSAMWASSSTESAVRNGRREGS
jgi:hypothetical protein